MSTFALLGAPIAIALLLVGIHTYFGLHILRRGVIFVDLALAQIAALGGLVAFLVGLPPGNPGSEIFSLVFALAGAALIAAMRPGPRARVPQEALIGLTYAFASALALLVMAEAPEGAEHLRESMTGTLLWTEWSDVGVAAAVYGGVAVVHALLGRKFGAVSEDPTAAAQAGLKLARVDFYFYATFAVTVTHSVRIAGVLLVFVFLVAPATLAMTWSRGAFARQLVIGWGVGLVVCLGGMALSVALDVTAAPTIIAIYALVLALSGLVRWLAAVPIDVRVRRAAGVLAVTGALVGLLVATRAGLVDLGDGHPHDDHEKPPSAAATASTPTPAAAHSANARPPTDAAAAGLALAGALAAADTPEEKQAACEAAHPTLPALEALAKTTTDPFDRLALARCLRRVDPTAGTAALRALAADPATPPFVRDAAIADTGVHR